MGWDEMGWGGARAERCVRFKRLVASSCFGAARGIGKADAVFHLNESVMGL
jgi:hypothetical protein